MKKTLKKYFIPHEGNNYHPHVLHTKRAIFYSAVFIAMKIIVVSFAVLLPLQVFVMPDILQEQQKQIINLTNEIRLKKGLQPLGTNKKLYTSSQLKADDMSAKEYFSHTGPDGKKLKDYMNEVGYKYNYAGENLAMGFTDAQSLVNAWVNSPTHYANLIDSDYKEFGVGLEVGKYKGLSTVYVAQHFGDPKVILVEEEKEINKPEIEVANSISNKHKDNKEGVDKIPKQLVAGEVLDNLDEEIEISEIDKNAPNEGRDIIPLMVASNENKTVDKKISSIVYNKDISKVYWKEDGEKTIITVKAYIVGDVEKVIVNINEYNIGLLQSEQPYVYHGQITVFEISDELFKVITTPSISIIGEDGTTIQDNIMWNNIKVVSPTPIEKYTRAKTLLGGFTNIFNVSKNIYLGFIVFFTIALALKIFIEFKKQHTHIIFQTILLLGLLVILFEI